MIYYLLTLICIPELVTVIGFIIPITRSWVKGLVEDSDGDPHHTDGLFMLVIWAAKWSFGIAFIAGVYTIVDDKDRLQVIITFLTAGTSLLGVRLFKNKFNLSLTPDKKE